MSVMPTDLERAACDQCLRCSTRGPARALHRAYGPSYLSLLWICC